MSQLKDAAMLMQADKIYPLLKPLAKFDMDDLAALVLVAIASLSYITRGTLWAKQEPGYHLFFESPQGKGVTYTKDPGARNIVEKLKSLVGNLNISSQALYADAHPGQRCCDLLRIAKWQK
jgi:hypothetical protein